MHSLHGYFVRPGDPTEPIEFTVETIRDGGSFSVRRSTAQQYGKTIFFMSASFQVREEGLDHHSPAPVDVPAPDEVPHHARLGASSTRAVRPPSPPRRRPSTSATSACRAGCRPATASPSEQQRVWMRIDGKLPDDPLLHACALTYASDLSLLDAVLSVHGEVWGPGGVIGASLDHALWLHRPFRADEWFLYDCTSPSASGGPRAGERPDVHPGRPAHRQRRSGGTSAPRRRAEVARCPAGGIPARRLTDYGSRPAGPGMKITYGP